MCRKARITRRKAHIMCRKARIMYRRYTSFFPEENNMGKFNGFRPGGGNMQDLMRQAQKMQENVQKVQEEVGNAEFETSVGGGAVKVVINGKKEFKSIEISPAAVDPDDIEMLQDLILSAVNEAIRTADETMEKEMEKVTGGLGGLGGFGF